MLKARVEEHERERDQSLSDKVAAEQTHAETKAVFNSTLFHFYTLSVIGRGSLSFLEDKYLINLAEVWEAILAQLEGSGYMEEELLEQPG